MNPGGFTGWVGKLGTTHACRLVAVARAEGLSNIDALDAVQEAFHTFLILPQARAIANHEQDSANLLAVIVRNAARNMRRKHHRARPHEEFEELSEPSLNTEELISQAEEHVRLLGCLNTLQAVLQRVVTLRMLEEMSTLEVSQELGLTPGHVAVLLHRAKKELQRCLLD